MRKSSAVRTWTLIDQQHHRCASRHLWPEAAAVRLAVAIPAVLMRRDDNGTLNQRRAPSGVITR